MIAEEKPQAIAWNKKVEKRFSFVGKGCRIFACGTCLKLRHSEGSDLCPRSTMKDLYETVKNSDKIITF